MRGYRTLWMLWKQTNGRVVVVMFDFRGKRVELFFCLLVLACLPACVYMLNSTQKMIQIKESGWKQDLWRWLSILTFVRWAWDFFLCVYYVHLLSLSQGDEKLCDVIWCQQIFLLLLFFHSIFVFFSLFILISNNMEKLVVHWAVSNYAKKKQKREKVCIYAVWYTVEWRGAQKWDENWSNICVNLCVLYCSWCVYRRESYIWSCMKGIIFVMFIHLLFISFWVHL